MTEDLRDELLVKFLLEETTTKEEEQVMQWLAESEEHRLYFEQMKTVWDESKSLQAQITISENESWERLKTKLTQPQGLGWHRKYMYYAAAILFLLGIFLFLRKSQSPVKEVAQSPRIEIPEDTIIPIIPKSLPWKTLASKTEIRKETLPDQSVVTLNKHAVLSCPDQFDSKERRVSLEGEAFFSITPNKEKPFFINAGNDVEIRVVGTSFNVKSYTDFTEVIVETGIVEVRKFNRVVLLHPREKAKIRKTDSSIVVQKHGDKLYKYYRSREFECDNLPLWRLVEVLNEAYGDSVVIGRKELRGLTLDTRFDNLPLEHILELLGETFDIKVEKQGNKYILK